MIQYLDDVLLFSGVLILVVIVLRGVAIQQEMSLLNLFIPLLVRLMLPPVLLLCVVNVIILPTIAAFIAAAYWVWGNKPWLMGGSGIVGLIVASTVIAPRVLPKMWDGILEVLYHGSGNELYSQKRERRFWAQLRGGKEPIFKPWVRRVAYGNKRFQHPHVVISSPHRCVWKYLLGSYPQLPDMVWQCDPRTRQEYLAIEEDVGSHLLAHEIARAIARSFPRLRVDVIAYRMARGIVDGNRVNRIAVQPIFDHGAHPELYVALRKLHRETVAQVWRALDTLHPEGLVIDCHSMATYEPSGDPASPVQAVIKSPTTIRPYVEAFLRPRDKRRPLDILTSTVGGRYLADQRLAEFITDELTRRGIEWAYNTPYSMTAYTMSALYMRRFIGRGIAFDVPKDYLTEQEGQDAARNLPYLTVSKRKVKALAGTIAEAISRRLQDERECVPSLGSR